MTMEVIIKCSEECRGGKNIYGEPITEVVRCKDCRHYGMGNCYMYGGQMNEDDFCSYGERSEPGK